MRHEVTCISDDIRFEVGKKITIAGLYDEAIVFQTLPSRILKLAVYQRWSDTINIHKVVIEVRGAPIGDLVLRLEGKPTAPLSSKEPHSARISLAFGPIDFLKEGDLEFLTFFNDALKPEHNHKLAVRIDAKLKLEI